MATSNTLDAVRQRRLYKYCHRHRHGDDMGIFWCSPALYEDLSKIELAAGLGIDYEPERDDETPGVAVGDESLGFEEIPLDSIPDLVPNEPLIGAGDPLTFLRGLDYELLQKQRGILHRLDERDDLDLSDHDHDALQGVLSMCEGIQDIGSDTLGCDVG